MRVVHEDHDGLLLRDGAEHFGKRPPRRGERCTAPQLGQGLGRRRGAPGRVEQTPPDDPQHAAPGVTLIRGDGPYSSDHGAVESSPPRPPPPARAPPPPPGPPPTPPPRGPPPAGPAPGAPGTPAPWGGARGSSSTRR